MNDKEIKYPCEICDYRMKYLDKHHIHSLSKGGMDIFIQDNGIILM